MKPGTTMLTAFAVVLPLALPSWAQVKELPTQTITISGTIETIDQAKRAMNIKTADGKFVAVNVPETVTRFQFKVGDKIRRRTTTMSVREAAGRDGRRYR